MTLSVNINYFAVWKDAFQAVHVAAFTSYHEWEQLTSYTTRTGWLWYKLYEIYEDGSFHLREWN